MQSQIPAMADTVRRRQRRYHVSSFGSWGYPEEFSIGRYLDPASPAAASGVTGCTVEGHIYPPPFPHYFYCGNDSDDLYGLPAPPPAAMMAAYPKKARKGKTQEKKQREVEEQAEGEAEAGRPHVCEGDVTSQKLPRGRRVHMAVDEDLYKIPPDLLHRKPSSKRTTSCKLLSSCLGLNCVP